MLRSAIFLVVATFLASYGFDSRALGGDGLSLHVSEIQHEKSERAQFDCSPENIFSSLTLKQVRLKLHAFNGDKDAEIIVRTIYRSIGNQSKHVIWQAVSGRQFFVDGFGDQLYYDLQDVRTLFKESKYAAVIPWGWGVGLSACQNSGGVDSEANQHKRILDADLFSGVVLAALGGKEQDIDIYSRHLAENGATSSWPNRRERIDSIRYGLFLGSKALGKIHANRVFIPNNPVVSQRVMHADVQAAYFEFPCQSRVQRRALKNMMGLEINIDSVRGVSALVISIMDNFPHSVVVAPVSNVDGVYLLPGASGRMFLVYNMSTVKRLASIAGSYGPVSALAHQLGYAVCGISTSGTPVEPKDVLLADWFSGYILGEMGATREQATFLAHHFAAEEQVGYFPPKSDRLNAIRDGWDESMAGRTFQIPE